MKCRLSKFLLLGLSLSLTGCGYGLKEIYPGNVYNSVDYYMNFYKEWDEGLNYHNENSKVINKDAETYVLDKDYDKVFTTFNDDNFVLVQPDKDNYSYSYDLYDDEYQNKKSYGQSFALSKTEPTFKYGYVSKLFNGQMFCNGKYELARVQIDEKGFGAKFKKEIKDYSYFAVNFKASLDYRRDGVSTNIPSHSSSIVLTINFYCKNDNETYTRVPVSYQIDNIKTNTPEAIGGSNYCFFGFDLSNINVSRMCGISFEYELLSDDYNDLYPEEHYTHCLLLYEVFLPGSTWH